MSRIVPGSPALIRPDKKVDKRKYLVRLDEMEEAILNLQAGNKKTHCISFLIVLASFNNFELSEARNVRIILYSVLSIMLEYIRQSIKSQMSIDPLQLHIKTDMLKIVQQLICIDMLYLLIRIVHHIPLSQSIFVLIHFFYTVFQNVRAEDLQERRSQPESKSQGPGGLRHNSLNENSIGYRRLQPALLFVLCKIIPSYFSYISLLFLVISTFNLVILAEVGRIGIHYGYITLTIWHYKLLQMDEHKNRRASSRVRRVFVKNCQVALSFLVVMQNILLLIFKDLRYEVSISLLQTLIIGSYSFVCIKKSMSSHTQEKSTK